MASESTLTIVNPGNGEVLGVVPLAQATDVDAVVERARTGHSALREMEGEPGRLPGAAVHRPGEQGAGSSGGIGRG